MTLTLNDTLVLWKIYSETNDIIFVKRWLLVQKEYL